MGVNQPDSEFEMAAQAGSEYAYLLAGSAEEKKRAEALIQKVHITPYFIILALLPLPISFLLSVN